MGSKGCLQDLVSVYRHILLCTSRDWNLTLPSHGFACSPVFANAPTDTGQRGVMFVSPTGHEELQQCEQRPNIC